MGTSQTKPSGPTSVCPLCHGNFRNPITLRCGHCFCQGCIGELWSGSPSGPYYCPECKYEFRKLPDFGGADAPSTSSSNLSPTWTLGQRLSSRYSQKTLLGKRRASSSSSRQNSGGYRLGSAPSSNSNTTVIDLSPDNDPPPRKKTATANPPPAEEPLPRGASGGDIPSPQNTPPSKTPSPRRNTPPDRGHSSAAVEVTNIPSAEPSTSRDETTTRVIPPGARSPPAEMASSPSNTTRQRESTPNSSPPTKSPKSSPVSNTQSARMDTQNDESFVPCHYCSSSLQRLAVKTCLICGASMCPEHLRAHLESPVFQSHPLVPAVNDISPWRCVEHQEMNRIYCRQCSVCVCTVCTVIGSHKEHTCVGIKEAERELRSTLKDEMKKIQANEKAVLKKISELTKKKESAQGVVEEARAGVQQHYQTMREALEQEEQQALLCVTQEERRVLGSVEEQLSLLQEKLKSVQSSFNVLQGLADAKGPSQLQDQAFILEYNKLSKSLSGLSEPVENLVSVQEVDRARLESLQEWTEKRLDTVIISLPHRDPLRLLYGTNPTLNPDTAHPKLLLSEENRIVTYTESQQSYPDQETRFNVFPQVLGSKAMNQGRYYWEVEVSIEDGRWKAGVCDAQIGRKGQKDNCRLGFYPNSWCLICEKGKVEALHDKTVSPVHVVTLTRLGILLDYEEGCLSFFSVAEGGALTLLYSFQHEFTGPLFPAFAVSKTQVTVHDLFQNTTTE
ncbi:E3 ubiquitin/ISG15 ligase TRIM25 [Chanos chanos]|uniref:E3 ubiquitin/ISG15 ligase TRIM25 n=1 Tax=Chanos chanos TaxID=29144 RepID=A0A6J2WBA1_CHACN|nr:E3 ubiquitin/ISG15 ligase TRIM25-like [Chanos chanos]